MEHQNPFSYAEFLRIFEHDDWFLIDETVFYLDYAPDEEYYLGCLREYEEPYWAGYCDISEGGCFRTASALLNAKIFHGRSVKGTLGKCEIFSDRRDSRGNMAGTV